MTAPLTPSLIASRIEALRQALARHALAALVVPSSDPHLSEYLPERWQGRQWASGFTGSVGTLVVTPTFAGVWVDSRYWVQADAELAGTGIATMRMPAASGLAHLDWLAEHLQPGDGVAADAQVLGLGAARALQAALDRCGAHWRGDLDLLDEVWTDRPGLPDAGVYAIDAPTSRATKLANVRTFMTSVRADWHVISTLDDIAWLFNLRGADVPYNPVFVAHALVGMDTATLFVAPGKIDEALRDTLARDGVRVQAYDDVRTVLGEVLHGVLGTGNAHAPRVLLDPKRVTAGLRDALPGHAIVIEHINPTTLAKSRKTAADAEQIRHTMAYDGAALAEFFAWFEQALGREVITELTVDERITAARARQPGFVSPSFGTIAAFNANGAMPHYHATPQSHAVISTAQGIAAEGLLLIDSGGQYHTGTTDITRVVPVGTPSPAQCEDFTRVLKGMIALSRTRFPRGTRSHALDAIARAPIWAGGIDYGHGTGHGVGHFLNVHEGPQSISPNPAPDSHSAMEPGMVTSNEPGIYRPGQWGVRIENLLLNVVANTTTFGEFLAFETLTLCPIDTRCIEPSLLDASERAWLDDYHAEVRQRVMPLLKDEAARAWLVARTTPLSD